MRSMSGQSAIRRSRQAGFTLVETMITVVIFAIVAMIAYPSFMQNIRKSNRIDAQTTLIRTASNLERFFAANGAYSTDTTQLGLMIDAGTAVSDDGHYIITVTAGATGIGSSYVISANATGDLQINDASCTTLSLDSSGRRTPDPIESDCW